MNSHWISVFPVGSCIPVLSWYPVPPILPLPPCSLPLYQRFHSSWFQFLVVILGPVILKGSFQSLSTPQLSIGHSDKHVGRAGAQYVPLGVNNPVLRAQFSASRVTANVRWCADLPSLCPESNQVGKDRCQTSTQEGQTNSGEGEKHGLCGCPSLL